MKELTRVLFLCCLSLSGEVVAYEYPLTFTPNPGARGLVVAGYAIVGNTVTGNCSYSINHAGSGRGARGSTTYYNQTCTWDLYGNLLGITQGAPAVPAPMYVNGTQTVYGTGANGVYTGSDTALPMPNQGFVNTPGSHYTWLTPNAYKVIHQVPHSLTVTLSSDGDVPLNISDVAVSALHGKATLTGGTCTGEIAVGATCAGTVTYDPSSLCSPPTGLSYDTLNISVTSDDGQATEFIQSGTIITNPNNPNACPN